MGGGWVFASWTHQVKRKEWFSRPTREKSSSKGSCHWGKHQMLTHQWEGGVQKKWLELVNRKEKPQLNMSWVFCSCYYVHTPTSNRFISGQCITHAHTVWQKLNQQLFSLKCQKVHYMITSFYLKEKREKWGNN